ncbi:lactate dehydrogenase [Xanthomonas perforans]|uniref:class I SAM-dependent DNA methyltransferase n=1 Tax=Xanthomonas perforans TaxID=442694 RepID=UPI00287CE04D|nr:DNA methyltransferase [Xanthomonas perforans]MDS6452126.1 lactate dehydrogenase [Xanthomonas perforans]MDS6460702.1 lactate dehydrogenase [Xanthomonas perforans]MDS6469228.1 lactate dehydrogenase [Xanthomonas perforans]MDS6477951.1 lactate dehydrogenase [Xanthomonas perforans]MDS6482354.1 lactate dehydrogenase [Xanthomonas perforans]
MNAVEIEQAITDLAEQPFDPAEFPYAFLEAFGNKATTIKRLRAGASNKSDLGGVLQTSNIHILTCDAGRVTQTLAALKASPATGKAKVKFILATDGTDFEAEDLTSGETVACAFKDFPDHFGFFLPLAGISTVRQISENAFDIRATSRLNRLYVELLKDNLEWGTAERRHDMNKLMARLIFCFFAEDTDIFGGRGKFTETVARMSAGDSTNTHQVVATLFRTMNTKREHRAAGGLPRWANIDDFPYVNGQLFSGGDEVPRFSKIARSYLLHVGGLDWTKINPDIFGSMIQAVAEDEERGELGMHYTSVPNILKVLNPLFLDDLRAKLEDAGDNPRTLLNLRKRIARIRVFDPACGSGNFLVIAYKEMRAIEAEINKRRGEPDRASDIPLTNFRGIELRDFPAEIARLSLVIAEYQCDVLYRGQKLALAEFLPLRNENWITCGNALWLDWLNVCPSIGVGVKLQSSDLFETPLDQAEIDFENEGGEIYICGNPPYKGSQDQTDQQKSDLAHVFAVENINSGVADYVLGWFAKAANFVRRYRAKFAFVATNSIHQGRQVARIWPALLGNDLRIFFAEPSFKWSNLASKKAVVTVSIIGISSVPEKCRVISDGLARDVDQIGPYMVPGPTVFVDERRTALSDVSPMSFGSMPNDGGALLMNYSEYKELITDRRTLPFVRSAAGTREFINGVPRYCVWVNDGQYEEANEIPALASRFNRVRTAREQSKRPTTNSLSRFPYRFGEIRQIGDESVIIVSKTASDNRDYIPASLLERGGIVTEAFGLFNAPLWNLAIVVSRLHTVWAKTVCGRMKSDPRYSNTLGWNTFPVPTLTDKNRTDLTRCAEDILLVREHHFPATIADLYDPDAMPTDLRAAHERNDEVMERIYIGRRFKNDTERLEKLFDLYTKMTASAAPAKGRKRKAGANA